MDTNESFKLSGTLKKILFFNEENHYYIAVLENDQKICGQYFDTDLHKLVGEEVIITGAWNNHKKYGVQFVFTSMELKEAEILRERINTLEQMDQFVGKYYSEQWVRKNILRQSEAEIADIDKQIAADGGGEDEDDEEF